MPSTMLWVSNLHAPGGRIWGAYVYFLCSISDEPDTVYIKIGVTSDPNGRLRHLIYGCPLKPVNFGFIRVKSRKQAFRIESCLHSAYRKWQTMGEWFKFASADKELFAKIRHAIIDPLRSPSWAMKMTTVKVMPGVRARLAKRRHFMRVIVPKRGRAFQDFQRHSTC